MYLVKSFSRDKGSGRYTMYLPFSPQGICRAKGADTLCICQTPCPEKDGLYQIHSAAEKRVFGKGSFRNLGAGLCFVFFCVLR